MFHITGSLTGIRILGNGTEVTVLIENKSGNMIRKRRIQEIELGIDDGRFISPAQRRKIYATLRDISNYTGYTVEAAKQIMKVEHMLRTGDSEYFSLSTCSMTTAREYINTLMEFALQEGIMLTESGLQRTDDVDYYLIQCIRYRKCCICGRTAEIHHVDAIGMGSDRKTVDDSEKEITALCRLHHTIAHQKGWPRMMEQYHIYGIEKKRAEV